MSNKETICNTSLKYGIVRMCEGKSLMLTPTEKICINMDRVENILSATSRFEDEFVKIDWNDTPVTIYSNGSMLFYHLTDKDVAESYATKILIALNFIYEDCSEKIVKAGIENVE